MDSSAARARPTYRDVVESSDRIRLRPQARAAGLEPRVPVVEIEFRVEPRLHVIAEHNESHGVPLAERRGLDAGGRDLTATAVVVIEAEVVLQCIGANEV